MYMNVMPSICEPLFIDSFHLSLTCMVSEMQIIS
jgi:hypothetical protein